ncbi:AAA-like domain-containing protein [Nostoc sp. C110]|uniref:AAA-like domain-containing protein n=1 Tax=Nostoc sp. C110 TaxID=3349876 RepID=UPI00370DD3B1
MNSDRPDAYDYQVGGSLKSNAFYVLRKADEDLYEFLKQGEFCYIFNCRQMGKSSVRVKVMERLKAEGVSCGAIDLTNIGRTAVTPEKWYGGIISELHRIFKLNKQLNPKSWLAEHHHLSPLQQLRLYLEDVILAHINTERIVIFIDEIDSVLSLNFRVDDFFALIRACCNQRADNSVYERLTFVLLGVATPSDLVQDEQQAPFNIGRAIALEGLEFEKSGILAEGLVEKAENPQQVLQEILQWTGGQPFLTQKLCQIVQTKLGEVILAGEEADKIQQLVRAYILDNWEFQDDPQHLRTIRDRLLNNEQKAGRLLGLYQQILAQGALTADGSSEQMDLKLSGLAVKQGNQLVVYNPIYQEIFNRDWLDEELTKLRPPFYAEAMKYWLASDKQDESYLLRGKALQEVQEWAKGKSLGDEDYQFLRASEQLETAAEREAKAILAEANRKAKQRIRVGSAVLIISLILAGMATAFASYLGQQNKNLANSNQDLKQNNEQLILGNDQLNQQQETLTKQIQDKEKEIQSATKKLAEANKNRDKALKLQKQAEQQALLAKGNEFKAEEARKQAELDLAKAENERQTAIKQIEIAQAEVKELEQKRQTIEQQLQIAEVKLRQAEQERQIALAGTKLERQGTSILQRFRAGSQGQIESLLEAMETGHSLYNLVKDGRIIGDYPAISPLYSLHTILQEIRAKNTFTLPSDTPSFEKFKTISPNGKYLATVLNYETLQLWDFKGNLIVELKGHQPSVSSIAFSPDGKYIATGLMDGTARLWDLKGNLVTESKGFQSKERIVAMSVAVSPDSKYLATGSKDKTARLWDFKGNLIVELKGHQGSVASVAFSPDGKYLITVSDIIRIWDLKGNLIDDLKDLKNFQGLANSVAFSPNGGLAIVSGDQISIFDGGFVFFKSPKGFFESVAFSPDGNYLATGSDDRTARLWDIDGNLVAEFKGHQGSVESVAFRPDGKYLITVSEDRTVQLWDIQGDLVTKFKGDPELSVPLGRLVVSPDGKYLATRSWDKTARLWDLKGNLIAQFQGHQASVASVAFSPDSKYLATGSDDTTARLWDIQGNLIVELKGHQRSVRSIAFSPDRKYLATGSKDKTARLWDFKGNLIVELKGHQASVTSVAFSLDGKYLATVSDIVRIWDLKGNLIAEFKGHQGSIESIAFSPDGKYLATGSDDQTARLWDLKGNLIAEFKGHQSGVWSIAFSPDGKYLATGDDQTARLWDFKENLIAEFKGHQGSIESIAFTPDGKYLTTGSTKDLVRLWKVGGLSDLLARGCDWLKDYLANHPDDPKAKEVRDMCKSK